MEPKSRSDTVWSKNRQLWIGHRAKSGRESTKRDCSELGFLKSWDLQCENVYSSGKARDADYPNCQFTLNTKVRKETRRKVFPSPAGVCSLSRELRVEIAATPRAEYRDPWQQQCSQRPSIPSPRSAYCVSILGSTEACWRKWTKYQT